MAAKRKSWILTQNLSSDSLVGAAIVPFHGLYDTLLVTLELSRARWDSLTLARRYAKTVTMS